MKRRKPTRRERWVRVAQGVGATLVLTWLAVQGQDSEKLLPGIVSMMVALPFLVLTVTGYLAVLAVLTPPPPPPRPRRQPTPPAPAPDDTAPLPPVPPA